MGAERWTRRGERKFVDLSLETVEADGVFTGYASLFGNQTFCDCAHCASILGPAAYFVDLMELVKQDGQSPEGFKQRPKR